MILHTGKFVWLILASQTAVSILFVGYILMQVPSNLLLNKVGKPGLYLPACVSRAPTRKCLTLQNHRAD